MTPSKVMWTDGELYPWRLLGVHGEGRTKQGVQRRRKSTTKVPKCGIPPEGDEVFGAVWDGALHVSDLRTRNETFVGSIVESGLDLFGKALDDWLPCFGEDGK